MNIPNYLQIEFQKFNSELAVRFFFEQNKKEFFFDFC